MSNDLARRHHSSFESLRHVDEDGSEYRPARELMPVLEYTTWRSFRAVVAEAMTAAEQADKPAPDRFAEVDRMVQLVAAWHTRAEVRAHGVHLLATDFQAGPLAHAEAVGGRG
ncbi:MAG: hypothetical protein FJ000_00105 [Actinobacteria bacterium]|nr:hypothetical protein [Actinomycetota bacterium]